MSFYSDASLVLIPSGVKAGKVYSQKPTDGSGDLTFTRASTATRTNSAGLIEKVRTNLILYSEQFDNAAWFKGNTTVTANNTTAPNGTNTADKIDFAAVLDANIQPTITTATTIGRQYTISFYARADVAINNVKLDSVGVDTDLAITTSWQRFTRTVTATASTTASTLVTRDAAATSIYLWGFQFEESDVVTDYIPTTTAAVTVGPTNNVPRLDYSGGATCPSLLLEGQRSNLILQSEAFDNASWFKGNTTVTANNTISPDGTNDADKINFAAVLDANIQPTIITATTIGTQYTISFYARADSSVNNVKLDSVGVDTDLAITTSWQRFTRTVTATASTTTSTLVTRDGVATSIYLWGFQFEAGSFGSSYIPTTTAAVTRLIDTALKTGISSLIGQTQGVLFWEGIVTEVTDIVAINTGVVNGVYITKGTGNLFRCYVYNSSNVISLNDTIVRTTNTKIALAYKSGDSALFVNGVKVATSASSITFSGALSEIRLNDNSFFLFGTAPQSTNQILTFNTRLTDAQCIELSTL
jgi:hypothetical protein